MYEIIVRKFVGYHGGDAINRTHTVTLDNYLQLTLLYPSADGRSRRLFGRCPRSTS